jgi:hypothetical protein
MGTTIPLSEGAILHVLTASVPARRRAFKALAGGCWRAQLRPLGRSKKLRVGRGVPEVRPEGATCMPPPAGWPPPGYHNEVIS